VTSSDSSCVIGGKMDGMRRASIVLPQPGGPTRMALCPPAAAISSARFATIWPQTICEGAKPALACLCTFLKEKTLSYRASLERSFTAI
jgi:hypothetical protein